MPLPTRSKSVKVSQRVDIDTSSDLGQSNTATAAALGSDGLSVRGQQVSLTTTRKATGLVNRSIPRATSNLTPASGENARDSSASHSSSTADLNGAAQKPLNRSAKSIPSSQSLAPKERTKDSLYSRDRHINTSATPSTRVPAQRHQQTRSIPTNQLATKNNTVSDLRKPAFNTFQQHYTPLKSNQRSTTSSTSAVKLPEAKTLGFETNTLDDELLQLQIVHRDSIRTLQQYQQSIDRRIQDAKSTLEQTEALLVQRQKDHAKLESLKSLKTWLDEGSPATNQEAVQQLSKTFEDLALLAKKIGDSNEAFTRFTLWHEHATLTRESRTLNSNADSASLLIPHLGQDWREDMRSIASKASLYRETLKHLSLPQKDGSGLYTLFSRHLALAETIYGLARTALNVEAQVTSSEKKWVAQEIEDALADHHLALSLSNVKQYVPAWHISR